MRLKTIKLAGFKTFVDPTTVKLPSNLCSIVGPNGCGKSNIIDAVRWVLGEGSAKHLRGESMADVIFNGSSGRKPLGQASIELVFDNTDGTLGGEYASYAEIGIRRTVSRDGVSNYYLNGARCRRRDITDIFLGTGLGPRSYAIIEQGMISRLIEAKPEDLRVYIEEAAGISRYKDRRRDTENRIRRTRENLERLTDLREELERQLQHLKRQASAAERYGELKTEERLLRCQLLALGWKTLDAESQRLGVSILDREVALAEVNARHTHVETSIEKSRERYQELAAIQSAIQERYYAVGAEIARTEQSVQMQTERARQFELDLEQTRRSHREAEEHLRSDEALLGRQQEEQEQVVPALEAAEAQDEEVQSALQAAEQTMQRLQSEWDAFNVSAEAPRQQVGVQQSRIRQLEEAMAQSAQRIEQLVRELRDLDTSTLEAEREAGEARVLELEDINRSWQERAEEARARIEAGRRDINTRGGELDELRGDLREQRGRFASLGALQQAALGQGDEKVSGWIAAQALSSASRLAERVTVDAGWDAAVETVLGRHLEAICVPDIDALAPSLALFGEGTLGLFSPLSTQGAVIRPGSLLAKVRADFDLGGLLGGVLAASTLEEALALRAGLGAGESVITHDGIWLGRDWLRVARDADPRAGVIRRAAELTELGTSIDTLREREAGLLGALEEARESLRAAEEGLVVLQQEQRAAAARYTEARSALSACAVRLEQMELRASRNRDEQQQYRERHESQRTSLQEARGILETALDAMHQDTQRREELQDARERARVALDAARSRSRESRESAHRLAMRRESLTAQIEALRAAIVRITGQFNTLEDRSRHLGEQIAATAMPIAEGKATLEGQLGRRLEVERELQSARAAVQGVEHELRESEKLRHATAQEAESARSVLERERLALQSVQVRIEGVLEQLERTGAVLPEVLQSLPPEAEEQAWQAQIERLAAQIARLGPINLAAIDEHRAQSERKTYLDAQNADLVEALDTLENAIRKIDRETRTRFKETFDKVNSGLQELFPRVFGGGHAYLELTGEDLLDTGVTIMARPPGKRNATIHLLSGGEKALTAISLVFSIFRLNPSPFCMLDEVDAPLDDANVGRFTRLVKEMSEQVQFIVITHNKITMEMAQHLMGVTMQEPGVSRLVSVDVDEAVALAEIA